MKLATFATPVVAAMLLGLYVTPARALPPAPYMGQGPGWDTPPGAYREFQRQGFHDGIEGARRDFEHHRPFTPENRDEYRRPHVPPQFYRDYREAFREGYHRAVWNLYPGGGPR